MLFLGGGIEIDQALSKKSYGVIICVLRILVLLLVPKINAMYQFSVKDELLGA